MSQKWLTNLAQSLQQSQMTENNNNLNTSTESKNTGRRNSQRSTTKLDDFTNLTQIGRGAFGQVYRATFKKLDRQFALKKISKKQIQNHYMVSQLSNQIQISKSLRHDNIIKLYDYFEEDQYFYLVLQYAAGGQLYSKLMNQGRFGEQETKNHIRGVISAVKYLHSRDPPIIHRDIKPENLLLDQTGRIKVADFGWSNFANGVRKSYCGTVHYLAPEMIDRSGHDQKLDIWCIGVLTYQLLTGKPPFMPKDTRSEAAFKSKMQENIMGVKIQFPEDFPTQAKAFVLGMIKRNPKERMGVEQIENHPWLSVESNPKAKLKPALNGPIQQDPRFIELQKKVKDLQEELTYIKSSPNYLPAQNMDNSDRATVLKQLRQIRVARELNDKITAENDQLANDIKARDKEIILLKSRLQKTEELETSLQRVDTDRKNYQQRIKKLQKQLDNARLTERKLRQQIDSMGNSVGNKVKNGGKITLKEMNTQQYIFFLQQQLQLISEKFEDNKKILNKVLERQKVSEEKEDQLMRLRVEQKNSRDEIRAELKEHYETQKDDIVLSLRNQVAEEREKWFKDYLELKNMYDRNTGGGLEDSSKFSDRENDLMLQIRNLKQVNTMYEKNLKNQQIQIKELQDKLKWKK